MNEEKIRYGVTNPTLLKTYCIFRAALKSPSHFLNSFRKDPKLKDGEITAIMCVWDEQENVRRAIKSSYEFVDKYIIIDKNGETIPFIKPLQDKYDLDVVYHIKSELNLLESRRYALQKTKSEWVMIQDGDEVFNNARGEINSIFNLREYMIYPNLIIKTKMNVLKLDFLHTQPVNNAHHAFLFHNNGDIHFGKADIPRGKGRVINLGPVYKWNLSMIKPIERMYYRNNFWGKYERSGLTDKYPSIQSFVENHLKIDVNENMLKTYENKLKKTAIPYNEKVQGKLPKILRNLVSKGIIS